MQDQKCILQDSGAELVVRSKMGDARDSEAAPFFVQSTILVVGIGRWRSALLQPLWEHRSLARLGLFHLLGRLGRPVFFRHRRVHCGQGKMEEISQQAVTSEFDIKFQGTSGRLDVIEPAISRARNQRPNIWIILMRKK